MDQLVVHHVRRVDDGQMGPLGDGFLEVGEVGAAQDQAFHAVLLEEADEVLQIKGLHDLLGIPLVLDSGDQGEDAQADDLGVGVPLEEGALDAGGGLVVDGDDRAAVILLAQLTVDLQRRIGPVAPLGGEALEIEDAAQGVAVDEEVLDALALGIAEDLREALPLVLLGGELEELTGPGGIRRRVSDGFDLRVLLVQVLDAHGGVDQRTGNNSNFSFHDFVNLFSDGGFTCWQLPASPACRA